jgi:DNA-binding MarR family transcriptional regulator
MILHSFDKTFEHRIRLQIMGVLVLHDLYDFVELKSLLGITDGNLASHMKVLEKEAYVEVLKSFAGKKPLTQYRATDIGKKAFLHHLDVLESFIHQQKQ